MKVHPKLWLQLKMQAKAISSNTHKLSHNALPAPDNLSQGKSQILVHGPRNGLLEKITHSLKIHHEGTGLE